MSLMEWLFGKPENSKNLTVLQGESFPKSSCVTGANATSTGGTDERIQKLEANEIQLAELHGVKFSLRGCPPLRSSV